MSAKNSVKAYQVMNVLGHRTRFGIMELLVNAKEMNVNTIQKELNKKFSKKHSQPTVSQNLGKLKKAGLIKSIRNSRIVNYQVIDSKHSVISDVITESYTLAAAA